MRQHHTSPSIIRGWEAKKKLRPVSGRNLTLDILFHRAACKRVSRCSLMPSKVPKAGRQRT